MTSYFKQFLGKFPEGLPPITLSDDTHHVFSLENEPLSEKMIADFITKYEPKEIDEFTEYVPCFHLPKRNDMVTLVYWKAGLMSYDYLIATFSAKTSVMIDKKVIAGTKVLDNKTVKRTIAVIGEDFSVTTAEGLEINTVFDAGNSVPHRYIINEDGFVEQEY